MIIPNGYIEIETTTGGGIDANGHALPVSVSFGSSILCQYTRTENLQQRIQGESQTTPSFTIYIENTTGVSLQSEKIRLKNRDNTVIGIFPVRTIEPLEAVNQIMLTV